MPISLGIGTAVTRGGGLSWSPLSISGLQFWVDANDSATLFTDSALTTLAVADGDVVGGWTDKSGNARNALQTDGTKKPLLKLAIQNGRNVVRWDGTNDLLSLSSTVPSIDRATFCVFKSSNHLTILGSSLNTEVGALVLFGNNCYEVGNSYYATSGVGSSGVFGLFSSSIDSAGTTIKQRKNGSDLSVGSNTAIGGSLTLNQIGNRASSGLGAGDICEILHYNSVLSSPDILLVEAYLKTKWGTP